MGSQPKLRVLLLGSHIGFNLEYYASLSLGRLGCDVVFLGHRKFLGTFSTLKRMVITRSSFSRRLAKNFGLRKFNETAKEIGTRHQPDIVFVIKGEAVMPETIDWFSSKLHIPTALWCPDDPRYFDALSRFIAPHYDFVFTPSVRFVAEYSRIGVRSVEFLPFACEPAVHRIVSLSPNEAKEYGCDISFVGMFSRKRAKAISILESCGLKIKVWGPYWRYFKPGHNVKGPLAGPEMTKAFNASRIVLNVHEESDRLSKPNMRVYEAAGCRSLVLTDSALGLDSHFVPSRELLCYRNYDEMVSLAKRYLKSHDLGREVAERGHERAYREHTYDQRMDKVLRTVS